MGLRPDCVISRVRSSIVLNRIKRTTALPLPQ
jgi:hypothetical protein